MCKELKTKNSILTLTGALLCRLRSTATQEPLAMSCMFISGTFSYNFFYEEA